MNLNKEALAILKQCTDAICAKDNTYYEKSVNGVLEFCNNFKINCNKQIEFYKKELANNTQITKEDKEKYLDDEDSLKNMYSFNIGVDQAINYLKICLQNKMSFTKLKKIIDEKSDGLSLLQ